MYYPMRALLVSAIIMLMLSACQPVTPEEPTTLSQEDGQGREVTITYGNDGIAVEPAEIPAGMATLVLENVGDTPHGGPIGRFKEGKSMDDFMASAGGGAFEALLNLDLYGARLLFPNEQEVITAELAAGDYLLLSSGPTGTPLFANLTVTPADSAMGIQPEADISVVMTDFAYGLPEMLPSGQQLWHIRNEGSQMHEIFVVPVDSETDLDAAADILRSIGSPFAVLDGSSPVDVAMLFGPLGPGLEAWTSVNLEPGTYAMGPLLPDFTTVDQDGPPTLLLDHDMVAVFTVE
jgi:hypothetical protein